MNIFVTNDDGYQSPLMQALVKKLAKDHNVTVVAPEKPQSCTGHALTMHKPVRLNLHKELSKALNAKLYVCSGKPADCVRLGLEVILNQKPDLLISGINSGANLGSDVMYSGTVAAAIEGCISGVPSIATSLALKGENETQSAVKFVCEFINRYPIDTIVENTILNINIPNVDYDKIKGIKVADLSIIHYEEMITTGTDQWGEKFYWIGGKLPKNTKKGSDSDYIQSGYATITPLTFLLQHQQSMQQIDKNIEKIFGEFNE